MFVVVMLGILSFDRGGRVCDTGMMCEIHVDFAVRRHYVGLYKSVDMPFTP